MDFPSYLWQLFLTAFWNPNNWFYSMFGWFTSVYTIVVVFILKGKKPMKYDILGALRKYRILILALLVLVTIVVSSYTIQSKNALLWQQNRPLIVINPSTQTEFSTDNTAQMATHTITFQYENVGKSTAYQFRIITCAAPENQPQDIFGDDDVMNPNPFQPQEQMTYRLGFSQPFERINGRVGMATVVWYIYVQLSYSDSLVRGNLYSEEYWYAVDSGGIRVQQQTEKQVFQPFVNNFYDIKGSK